MTRPPSGAASSPGGCARGLRHCHRGRGRRWRWPKHDSALLGKLSPNGYERAEVPVRPGPRPTVAAGNKRQRHREPARRDVTPAAGPVLRSPLTATAKVRPGSSCASSWRCPRGRPMSRTRSRHSSSHGGSEPHMLRRGAKLGTRRQAVMRSAPTTCKPSVTQTHRAWSEVLRDRSKTRHEMLRPRTT